MRLLKESRSEAGFSSLPRENQHLHLEFTPRTVVRPLSAAPPWEAQMLCWLAFGDRMALESDTPTLKMFIPTWGKPTIPLRIYPADGRETPLRRTPLGGPKCFAG